MLTLQVFGLLHKIPHRIPHRISHFVRPILRKLGYQQKIVLPIIYNLVFTILFFQKKKMVFPDQFVFVREDADKRVIRNSFDATNYAENLYRW